jgi:hypothetical protein
LESDRRFATWISGDGENLIAASSAADAGHARLQTMEGHMDEHNELHEHRIREVAFQLWQEAGSPEGRADEFWQRAKETVETASAETTDLDEEEGGHYPPTGDTQNFA